MSDHNQPVADAVNSAHILLQVDETTNEIVMCDAFMEFAAIMHHEIQEAAREMVMLITSGATEFPNGQPIHDHTVCALGEALGIAFVAGMEYREKNV